MGDSSYKLHDVVHNISDFIKGPTLNVQVGRQTPAIIIIIIIIIFQIIIILIQQRRIIVRGSPMGGFFQSKIDGIFQGN